MSAVVVAAGDADRVRMVARAVDQVEKCGMRTDTNGFVWLYATSVERLHALAEVLYTQREAFAAMPVPAWWVRVESMREEPYH
jgi:hypothetical protein